jgi:DNA-binding transcriptional regulator YiaG
MLKMQTSSGACRSASLRKEMISSSLRASSNATQISARTARRASSERAAMVPPASSMSFTSGASFSPLRRPAKIENPSLANFLAISAPI